jgi:hypothetical protein
MSNMNFAYFSWHLLTRHLNKFCEWHQTNPIEQLDNKRKKNDSKQVSELQLKSGYLQ